MIAKQMAPMLRFQELMTPELREEIIRYKLSILTPELRTPRFSGFFVYQAFLEEGLTDWGDVTAFLRANGIDIGGN